MSALVRFGSCRSPRLRLVGFPYAGGSATLFARWHLGLPAGVEVLAVELSGRGARLREPLPRDAAQVTEEVAGALAALDDVPCVFFGHSLGALLAYTTTCALRRRDARLPRQLFVSARRPPDAPRRGPVMSTLDDAGLVAELRRYNGLAREILAEPELMAMFLPIIRADFRVLESYRHVDEAPLALPITAFAGARDQEAAPADLVEWRRFTSGEFTLSEFDGDHFFVNALREQVVARVAERIARV
jgi:medium-chain acyl-[acyl-carrier-protein] hydrolase